MAATIDVALILWNTDVIHLVSLFLRDRNLTSKGMEPSNGVHKVEEMIGCFSPSVVVFDLYPPYSKSTTVLMYLQTRFPASEFVITCADPMLVLKAAPWLTCCPMFQKPYEMSTLSDTVNSMVRSDWSFSNRKTGTGLRT